MRSILGKVLFLSIMECGKLKPFESLNFHFNLFRKCDWSLDTESPEFLFQYLETFGKVNIAIVCCIQMSHSLHQQWKRDKIAFFQTHFTHGLNEVCR